MSALMGDAADWHVGRVDTASARKVDGWIFTELEVVSDNGEIVVLSVPGGELDGIGQRFGDAPLPRQQAELLIATQTDGSQRWAYHDRGALEGGWLGHGPAIIDAL